MGSNIPSLHSWFAETCWNLAFNGLLCIYSKPPLGFPVVMRLVQVCFVCAMAAPPHLKEQPLGEWFVFTAMTAFWVSLVLMVRPFIHIYHSVSGDVFGARYRKVPRDPLADDRVWILCALVFLLLHSRPGLCSQGEAHYFKLG